jgi:hypothetical protein
MKIEHATSIIIPASNSKANLHVFHVVRAMMTTIVYIENTISLLISQIGLISHNAPEMPDNKLFNNDLIKFMLEIILGLVLEKHHARTPRHQKPIIFQ